jgi:hypothetical protein
MSVLFGAFDDIAYICSAFSEVGGGHERHAKCYARASERRGLQTL